ncbi:unnamed protein product [Caretta caretta]
MRGSGVSDADRPSPYGEARRGYTLLLPAQALPAFIRDDGTRSPGPAGGDRTDPDPIPVNQETFKDQ